MNATSGEEQAVHISGLMADLFLLDFSALGCAVVSSSFAMVGGGVMGGPNSSSGGSYRGLLSMVFPFNSWN